MSSITVIGKFLLSRSPTYNFWSDTCAHKVVLMIRLLKVLDNNGDINEQLLLKSDLTLAT